MAKTETRNPQPVAGQRHKTGGIWLIPLVFVGFLVGLANMIMVPVLYIYEIMEYNKKNEWPGWSGVDALNYTVTQKRQMFSINDTLYWMDTRAKVIDLHAAGLTKAANLVATLYLDSSIIFICFLQGVILLWFSVRTALFRLNREGM